MLPEQQQRILGYFIEEARDHLNTIEQGLMNLQRTLNDPEMVNEVFRAAHSIKGSAAMLGLNSIQHTSHRLEDCFKVLKEHPVQVDQKLESLFLGVSDTLKVLLEHLSGPFGLSEDAANTLMLETEPVFKWLYEHLELLVQQNNSGVVNNNTTTEIEPHQEDRVSTLTDLFLLRDIPDEEEDTARTSTQLPLSVVSSEAHSFLTAPVRDHWDEFQTQVLQALREMLQLFKQKTTPESRQNLQRCCQQLVQLGQTWNLPHWCRLCQAAANAIANPENSYLTLAKIIITEIKQAQELVLQNRDTEIATSQQLAALLNLPELELLQSQDLLAHQPASVADEELFSSPDNLLSQQPTILQSTDSISSLTELSEQLQPSQDISVAAENPVPTTARTQMFFLGSEEDTYMSNFGQNGPEVGLAELNTLADLFAGDTPELDETWQQEEVLDVSAASELGIDFGDNDTEDVDHDLADFLSFDADNSDNAQQISLTKTEDLNILFGSNFAETEHQDQQEQPILAATSSEAQDSVVNDFIDDSSALTIDDQELLTTGEVTQPKQISSNQESSFDDLFSATDNGDIEEILPDNYVESKPNNIQPESLTLDGLFDDFNDDQQLSNNQSEVSDLFDITPATQIEFTQTEENLNDFWNQETATTEAAETMPLLEQDVAKALEESLLAAASGDIFGNIEEFIPTISTSIEDDDLTFYEQDLILPSDTADGYDLFADLAAFNSISPTDDDDEELTLQEIGGFSQEPEALDITPEFTKEPPPPASVDSPPVFADLAVGLFDNLAESPQVIGSEIAQTDELDLTDVQLDDADSLVEDDDLFAESPQVIGSEIAQTDELDLTDVQLDDADSLVEDDDLFAESPQVIGSEITQTDELDLTDVQLDDADNLVEDDDLFAESPQVIGSEIAQTDELDLTDVQLDDADSLVEDDDLFAESPQVIGSEIAQTDELDLTYVQLDDADNLVEDDDLFAESPQVIGLEIAQTDELDLTDVQLDDADNLVEDDDLFAESPQVIGSEIAQTDELDLTYVQLDDADNLVEDDDLFAESPQVIGLEIAQTDELDLTYVQLDDADSLVEDDDLFASETSLDRISPEDLELQQFEAELEFADVDINSGLAVDVDITPATDLVDDLFAAATEQPAVNPEELLVNDIAESLVVALDDRPNELHLEDGEIFGETADLSDDLWNTDSMLPNQELAQSENANFVLSAEEVISVTSPTEAISENETYLQDEFSELEALLEEETTVSSPASSMPEEDFASLEALLNPSDDEEVTVSNEQPSYTPQFELTTRQIASNSIASADVDDEFSDLEKLLAEADQTISHSPPVKPKSLISKISRSSDRLTARFEETMKVPVKQLDDMSNLVGELVVNRNTLEQDHERLRQSLDNLLVQVQHLSDVGARMQELYERSLLEASLLASRTAKEPKEIKETNANNYDSHTDMGFSELEMDRFTPFHTLSQEMIEFIVRVRESASDIDFVTEESERVARQFRQVTTQLQEGLTRARMVPFSQTIDRLRRGVRDNAIKYGKQVNLVIEGGDTLIDKMILDHLTDPLTHMLNNAIAHGIETPDIRKAAGKPPVGYITIRAFYQGNQTVISVGDDGAGIDPERIKTKAVQLGMLTAEQAKSISRLEVYDLLFQPGFSIKDKADEISGRGVGMDVVRSEISEIRGIVNTNSTISEGTTFTIRLPLTLSICKALCCVSDKARIAFPMDGVEDTLDIPLKSIQHHADGQSYISWRDKLLPFRPLKELLTFNRQLSCGNVYGGNRDDDMVSVVVVRSGNTLIALQIDLVLSEQEIVIKQFESPAPKPIGVAGATVLGDGRIMPIADVLEIIDIFQGRISKHNGSKLWQQQDPNLPESTVEKIDPTVLIVDDSITVRELLSLTFNKAGYRVEQARDGQEAWDKLRSGLPCDIVFCDIEMPRCDGLELLSRIQKDSNLNHLPIAMLTSRGADKHRQMAIQLGASGYFTKPYLEEALLEAAVRMLSGEKLVTA